MCSLSSTTITRFIGIFGVVTSLLLINLLAKTDLNLQENVQPTTKILLGLEWRDLVPFENRNLPKGTELPLSILAYGVLNAIANLFLILASITQNSWYTSPWIFTQSTGIVCQCVSLYIHCTQYHDYQPQLIFLASSYIGLLSNNL
ncbi:uncharacterized protein LOC123293351 isoform X2 [Chrysoperla carnea]|uniref:uncharacterized protein LOC123293351 isoform X2 n=1 Tax=Chrysoperla carnea TaxID=189513 RepID=UPI001D064442|nr:uncharacterized protein LOC123293351 isoform X2 [Chrysoperla carnea]